MKTRKRRCVKIVKTIKNASDINAFMKFGKMFGENKGGEPPKEPIRRESPREQHLATAEYARPDKKPVAENRPPEDTEEKVVVRKKRGVLRAQNHDWEIGEGLENTSRRLTAVFEKILWDSQKMLEGARFPEEAREIVKREQEILQNVYALVIHPDSIYLSPMQQRTVRNIILKHQLEASHYFPEGIKTDRARNQAEAEKALSKLEHQQLIFSLANFLNTLPVVRSREGENTIEDGVDLSVSRILYEFIEILHSRKKDRNDGADHRIRANFSMELFDLVNGIYDKYVSKKQAEIITDTIKSLYPLPHPQDAHEALRKRSFLQTGNERIVLRSEVFRCAQFYRSIDALRLALATYLQNLPIREK